MPVGYCTLQLRLPENGSLKGKRQVLRSLVQRVRGQFNVSIAEVADHDSWQRVELGISCVSTDGAHCHEQLERVVSYVQAQRLDAELVDYAIEIIHP